MYFLIRTTKAHRIAVPARPIFLLICGFVGLITSGRTAWCSEGTLVEAQPITAEQIGQRNPLVPANASLTGVGVHTSVNTWVPFSFTVPEIKNLVVCEAWIEVQIQGIDANGDGRWDCLPSTDALAVLDADGNWNTVYGDFTRLYKAGEAPRIPKAINRGNGQFSSQLLGNPALMKILTEGGKLDAVIQDDSSVVTTPTLHLIYGPIPDPKVELRSSMVTLQPRCGFPPLPAQPGGGGIAAVGATPATIVRCNVDFTLRVRWLVFEGQGFRISVEESLSPGIDFIGLTASSVSYTVNNTPRTIPGVLAATPVANGVSFDQNAGLNKPEGTFAHIDYHYKIQYDIALNAQAIETPNQKHFVRLWVRGLPSNSNVLIVPLATQNIDAALPQLGLNAYLNASTGVSGDRRRVVIFVRNNGNTALEPSVVHALIPPGATYVQGSANPAPNEVTADRIRWISPGGEIPAGSHDVLGFEIQLGPDLQNGTELPFEVWGSAGGKNPWDAGDLRVVNAKANEATLTVSPVNTTIQAELSASPSAACFGTLITYTAKVTNEGQFPLENTTLQVRQQTRPYGGNPAFPVEIGTIPAGGSRTVTYKGDIGILQRGALVDAMVATGTPMNQGVRVAPPVTAVDTTAVTVPVPTVTSVSPVSGQPGTLDLELVIKGTCFAPGAIPKFYDSSENEVTGIQLIEPEAPNFGWQNHEELRHRINIADDAIPGTVRVRIVNPNGDVGEGTPPADAFMIEGGTPPNIMVTPASLNFGEVPVGEEQTESVVVRNTGQSLLSVSSVSLGGASGFVVEPSSFTVPGGAEQQVNITFKPEVVGPSTPSLAITSNDPDQGTITVQVQATATPASMQTGEADVSLTSLSLRFEEATTVFDGQQVTLKASLALDPEVTNGELANSLLIDSPSDLPLVSGPGEFFSHLTSVTLVDRDGFELFYGFVEMNIPATTDGNGDGFPDFYDRSLPVARTTTTGVFDDFFGEGGQVTAEWSRNGGSTRGNCKLSIKNSSAEFPIDITVDVPFELMTYSGKLQYERLQDTSRGTMSLTLDQTVGPDLDATLTAPIELTQLSEDQLGIDDGMFTNGGGNARPYLISNVERFGSAFLSVIEMDETDDGKQGYFSWVLRIQNDSDQDQDGIPDLSDSDTSAQPGTSLENWKQNVFGANANNPAIAGDLADPDKDGLENLLEYVLGSTPLNGGNRQEPVVSTNQDTFQLSFPINPGATDVGLMIERGALNQAWNAVARRSKGDAGWDSLAAGINVSGANQSVTVSGNRNSVEEYYRLQVQR